MTHFQDLEYLIPYSHAAVLGTVRTLTHYSQKFQIINLGDVHGVKHTNMQNVGTWTWFPQLRL